MVAKPDSWSALLTPGQRRARRARPDGIRDDARHEGRRPHDAGERHRARQRSTTSWSRSCARWSRASRCALRERATASRASGCSSTPEPVRAEAVDPAPDSRSDAQRQPVQQRARLVDDARRRATRAAMSCGFDIAVARDDRAHARGDARERCRARRRRRRRSAPGATPTCAAASKSGAGCGFVCGVVSPQTTAPGTTGESQRFEQRRREARGLVGDDAPPQRARLDRVEHRVDVRRRASCPRTAPPRSDRETRRAARGTRGSSGATPMPAPSRPRAPCDAYGRSCANGNGREAHARRARDSAPPRDRARCRRACRRDRTARRRPPARAARRRTGIARAGDVLCDSAIGGRRNAIM